MLYVIELERPIGDVNNPHGAARYYLGYCGDSRLSQRLREHRSGAGAAILRAANQQGIAWRVVLTLRGTRADERAIKNQKDSYGVFIRRVLSGRSKWSKRLIQDYTQKPRRVRV